MVVEGHDVVEVALIHGSAAVGSAAVVVGVGDGAPQYLRRRIHEGAGWWCGESTVSGGVDGLGVGWA